MPGGRPEKTALPSVSKSLEDGPEEDQSSFTMTLQFTKAGPLPVVASEPGDGFLHSDTILNPTKYTVFLRALA